MKITMDCMVSAMYISTVVLFKFDILSCIKEEHCPHIVSSLLWSLLKKTRYAAHNVYERMKYLLFKFDMNIVPFCMQYFQTKIILIIIIIEQMLYFIWFHRSENILYLQYVKKQRKKEKEWFDRLWSIVCSSNGTFPIVSSSS